MVIKMKSILFQTVFKNIRCKRRASFQPPALDSFTRPIGVFLFLKSRNLNTYF